MPSNGPPGKLAGPFEQMARRRIAVIGGGIIGLSTAYAAAVRGQGKVRVSLFEAREVGHPEAASSDLNRVFRYLHGPDPSTLAWAKEACAMWDFFGEEAGEPLLHRTGVLFLMHRQSDSTSPGRHVWPYHKVGDWVEDSLHLLDAEGLPYRRLTYKELAHHYSQISDPSIEEAVLDQGAGFLEAQRALATLADLCRQAGVELHPNEPVQKVTPDDDGCLVQTEDGEQARVDAAVVAVNGWTPDILPLPEGTLALAEQPLIYLSPPGGGAGLSKGEIPIFISLNTDCYGFPIYDGLVKVGDDKPYRTIDHPSQRREPQEEYIHRVVETVGRFVPALKGARVARTHVCFYDRSRDERFILDSWDADARIVYGCGMSGRAFKFAPVIGERLARFAVSGQRPHDLEDFRVR